MSVLLPFGNPAVDEAHRLYDAGLNVFPVIKGTKLPYGEHGMLQMCRMSRSYLRDVMWCSNIAVMTGRLSANLFVLDCDSWESFATIGKELAQHQIQPWIRNGCDGGQYWLRCADGEIVNENRGDMQILGNRLYTLAPPSIHPCGMVYEWISREADLPPVVSIAEMAFLGLQLARSQPQPHREHVLPAVAHRVLVDGNTDGYEGNSEAEYAACLSLICAGHSDADIAELFKVFGPPHYLKAGDRNFRRQVIVKARAWHEAHPMPMKANITTVDHLPYVSWATKRPWPGRSGGIDRAVYLALCERMRMERRTPFRASVREVAELAAVNKETVSKSLHRLEENGYIQHKNETEHSHARMYLLLMPSNGEGECVMARTSLSPTGVYATHTIRDLSGHDVWRHGGLGKSAKACWEMLSQRNATVAEIAEATGRSLPTVRRVLKALQLHGMADETDGTWSASAADSEHLDSVSIAYGTQGRGVKQKHKHVDERERWTSRQITEQVEMWMRKNRQDDGHGSEAVNGGVVDQRIEGGEVRMASDIYHLSLR